MSYLITMPEDYSLKMARRIGKNIQRKRLEANMTIYHLSTRTGINWNTIKHWEHGENVPRIDFIIWLCKVMGWKLSELIGKPQEEKGDGKLES